MSIKMPQNGRCQIPQSINSRVRRLVLEKRRERDKKRRSVQQRFERRDFVGAGFLGHACVRSEHGLTRSSKRRVDGVRGRRDAPSNGHCATRRRKAYTKWLIAGAFELKASKSAPYISNVCTGLRIFLRYSWELPCFEVSMILVVACNISTRSQA